MFPLIQIDLKAFERRLTEVISCVHPSTVRWRCKCIRIMLLFIQPDGVDDRLFCCFCLCASNCSFASPNVSHHIDRCLELVNRPENSRCTFNRIPTKSLYICHSSVSFVYVYRRRAFARVYRHGRISSGRNKFDWSLFFALDFPVSLFVVGIHKLVIAPQILTSRTRQVLNDFNMSCDDTGKLILKPRPTT